MFRLGLADVERPPDIDRVPQAGGVGHPPGAARHPALPPRRPLQQVRHPALRRLESVRVRCLVVSLSHCLVVLLSCCLVVLLLEWVTPLGLPVVQPYHRAVHFNKYGIQLFDAWSQFEYVVLLSCCLVVLLLEWVTPLGLPVVQPYHRAVHFNKYGIQLFDAWSQFEYVVLLSCCWSGSPPWGCLSSSPTTAQSTSTSTASSSSTSGVSSSTLSCCLVVLWSCCLVVFLSRCLVVLLSCCLVVGVGHPPGAARRPALPPCRPLQQVRHPALRRLESVRVRCLVVLLFLVMVE